MGYAVYTAQAEELVIGRQAEVVKGQRSKLGNAELASPVDQ